MKPIEAPRLLTALERARAALAGQRGPTLPPALERFLNDWQTRSGYADRLAVRDRHRIVLIRIADVDWLESADNYVTLHVGRRTYLIRQTMKALEARLDPARFLRIRRSVMVNVDRVVELRPEHHGDTPCGSRTEPCWPSTRTVRRGTPTVPRQPWLTAALSGQVAHGMPTSSQTPEFLAPMLRIVSAEVTMARTLARTTGVWLVTLWLAAMCLIVGTIKFTQAATWDRSFNHWGYATWFRPVVGGARSRWRAGARSARCGLWRADHGCDDGRCAWHSRGPWRAQPHSTTAAAPGAVVDRALHPSAGLASTAGCRPVVRRRRATGARSRSSHGPGLTSSTFSRPATDQVSWPDLRRSVRPYPWLR